MRRLRLLVTMICAVVSLTGCAGGLGPQQRAAQIDAQDDALCRQRQGAYQECRAAAASLRRTWADTKARADSEHAGYAPMYREHGWSIAALDAADDADCRKTLDQSQDQPAYLACRRSLTQTRLSAIQQLQATQPQVTFCNQSGTLMTCY